MDSFESYPHWNPDINAHVQTQNEGFKERLKRFTDDHEPFNYIEYVWFYQI